jgi:hypothetical protein
MKVLATAAPNRDNTGIPTPALRHPAVIWAASDEPGLKKLRGRLRHFVLPAVDHTAKQLDRCIANWT